jgi:hypothetical protein
MTITFVIIRFVQQFLSSSRGNYLVNGVIVAFMERAYYPSLSKVIKFHYLIPAVGYLLVYVTTVIVDFLRGSSLSSFDWVPFLGVWLAHAGLYALSDGLRAERFAVKITGTAISGPIAVGRAEPIQFDEVDYQKTFNSDSFMNKNHGNRVYSIHGDQIFIHENLFQPEQVSEIWATLDKAMQQQAS